MATTTATQDAPAAPVTFTVTVYRIAEIGYTGPCESYVPRCSCGWDHPAATRADRAARGIPVGFGPVGFDAPVHAFSRWLNHLRAAHGLDYTVEGRRAVTQHFRRLPWTVNQFTVVGR